MVLSFGKYLGQQKLQKSLPNYQLTLHSYDGHEKLPMHCHKFPYISLALDGLYQESAGKYTSQIVVDHNILVFRPGGYEHSNLFQKKGGACFNIEFKNPNTLKNIYSSISQLAILPNNLLMTKVLNSFINNENDDVLQLLIEEMMVSMGEQTNSLKQSNVVRKTVDLLKNEFSNSFSLSQIADIVGVHPVYLARKFKASTHSTIGEYLRDLRLKNAFYMLKDSEKNLTSVAYEAGFYDQSHFSRNFKQEFGLSPRLAKKHLNRLI